MISMLVVCRLFFCHAAQSDNMVKAVDAANHECVYSLNCASKPTEYGSSFHQVGRTKITSCVTRGITRTYSLYLVFNSRGHGRSCCARDTHMLPTLSWVAMESSLHCKVALISGKELADYRAGRQILWYSGLRRMNCLGTLLARHGLAHPLHCVYSVIGFADNSTCIYSLIIWADSV